MINTPDNRARTHRPPRANPQLPASRDDFAEALGTVESPELHRSDEHLPRVTPRESLLPLAPRVLPELLPRILQPEPSLPARRVQLRNQDPCRHVPSDRAARNAQLVREL